MPLTPYHAKYFAHELAKRSSSDSLQKLAPALLDARVDLNPHQVDAALFAFQSPLSKGAILADEVGLGKTIEAGIVISRKWAERNSMFEKTPGTGLQKNPSPAGAGVHQIHQPSGHHPGILSLRKPVINVNEAALHLHITYKVARDLIKDFEKLGILKEVTDSKRNMGLGSNFAQFIADIKHHDI